MNDINPIAQSQIKKIREKCEIIKPLVVIECITYNHEQYIRDALDGFIMQNTNFPVVVVVHEDASTDDTAAILREYTEIYPDLIFPIYEKENQYSKHNGSVTRITGAGCFATGAKYIALCEGDDYWTDPLKLQKQVDFLESHPEYGLCYTKVYRYLQDSQKTIDIWGGPNESFDNLINLNSIPTPTVLMRVESYKNYNKEINPSKHRWLMGDYPLWLYIALNFKIHFMDETTGVYRILKKSASHSIVCADFISFCISRTEIRSFFISKYKKNNNLMECEINYLKFLLAYEMKNKTQIAKYSQLLKTSIFENDIPLKHKVKYTYAYLFPNHYLKNFKKRNNY